MATLLVQAASQNILKGANAFLQQPAALPALITGIAVQYIIRSGLALYQGKDAKPLSMGQQVFVQLFSGALGYATATALGLGFMTGTAQLVAVLAPLVFFAVTTFLTKQPTPGAAALLTANHALQAQLDKLPTAEQVALLKGRPTPEQLTQAVADATAPLNKQIIQLSAEDPRATIAVLQGELATAKGEAAKVEGLNDQLAALQGELATAKGEAAKVEGLNDQLAALQGELATAQEQAGKVGGLNEQLAALQAQLETAQGEAGKVEGLNGQLAALQAQLETAQGEAGKVGGLNEQLAALQAQLETAQGEAGKVEGLNGQLAALQAQLETAQGEAAKVKGLDARVAELEAALGKAGEVSEFLTGLTGSNKEIAQAVRRFQAK